MIRRSALFALVSPHEGHPKSLLEAMSCGVAILGADSPGIREQIVHGETGWLVGPDVESIRAGIQHLLANPSLREKLGANARRFVLENYSLDRILGMEYAVYEEIIKR
jgi:glycosyltransferase involved in cell wall biosynthesis